MNSLDRLKKVRRKPSRTSTWESWFLGILGNLRRVKPSFGTWMWRLGLRDGFEGLNAELRHEKEENWAMKPGTLWALFIAQFLGPASWKKGCPRRESILSSSMDETSSAKPENPSVMVPRRGHPCHVVATLIASDFVSRTFKICNLRVWASISTFYICTHRW